MWSITLLLSPCGLFKYALKNTEHFSVTNIQSKKLNGELYGMVCFGDDIAPAAEDKKDLKVSLNNMKTFYGQLCNNMSEINSRILQPRKLLTINGD